jgi:hypothetical protein
MLSQIRPPAAEGGPYLRGFGGSAVDYCLGEGTSLLPESRLEQAGDLVIPRLGGMLRGKK